MAAVLQQSGRIFLATAVAAPPLYLAWGRGLPAWDTKAEPEPTNATRLVDEIGRRLITSVSYVVPDENGAIELPDKKRYTVSVTQTKWLHVSWTFAYEDAAGETVREIGVFIGGTLVAGLPAGQRYFTAAQVVEPGYCYCVEHVQAFKRGAGVRPVQQYVLPF
ncbi:hypothetical protein M4R23_09145 [Acidovorax sp. GBBC 3332]|nr:MULTISPECIES: hypothetical protein [unclassified Acidovorax]MDA8449849.1 hypothetical protein [Acidovorax sp. GBBC 3297]MDA8459294.1 hypothetical protein [Acidovorax sp. GBBC 3333]MDA8464331.1 hypothetical protein [Acidovorax sp. GBBC 3332]MDA8469458.1 hypothetical protein [Acidovorax sp. GBBC 3299]